jgi:hypothetical protein
MIALLVVIFLMMIVALADAEDGPDDDNRYDQ